MSDINLGNVADFPSGRMRAFVIGDTEIAVANVDGSFYAFSNFCTHRNEYLTDGYLIGKEVICAFHEATYDLATGEIEYGPAFEPLAVYPVSVHGEELFVEWPAPAPESGAMPIDHEEGRLERQFTI